MNLRQEAKTPRRQEEELSFHALKTHLAQRRRGAEMKCILCASAPLREVLFHDSLKRPVFPWRLGVLASWRKLGWSIAALLIFACPAKAEHFLFDLTIDNGREKVTGLSDTDPPEMGLKPRPVIHVKKGGPLVFQFFMTSNFPHDALKKVGVHYYITPEKEVGQKTRPPIEHTILEGHFVMDFKPNTGRVGVRHPTRIDQPGVYLVRVESEHSDTDHEHFSAIDVVVE